MEWTPSTVLGALGVLGAVAAGFFRFWAFAAIVLTLFAGAASVTGLMVLETPILWPTDVGGVFFNLLLLGYALPALLALLKAADATS